MGQRLRVMQTQTHGHPWVSKPIQMKMLDKLLDHVNQVHVNGLRFYSVGMARQCLLTELTGHCAFKPQTLLQRNLLDIPMFVFSVSFVGLFCIGNV